MYLYLYNLASEYSQHVGINLCWCNGEHIDYVIHVSWVRIQHIGRLARMSVLDTEVDGSNPGSSMLFPRARHFIRIASVDSAVK